MEGHSHLFEGLTWQDPYLGFFDRRDLDGLVRDAAGQHTRRRPRRAIFHEDRTPMRIVKGLLLGAACIAATTAIAAEVTHAEYRIEARIWIARPPALVHLGRADGCGGILRMESVESVAAWVRAGAAPSRAWSAGTRRPNTCCWKRAACPIRGGSRNLSDWSLSSRWMPCWSWWTLRCCACGPARMARIMTGSTVMVLALERGEVHMAPPLAGVRNIALAPGDPALVIAGEIGGAPPEVLAGIRAACGLNLPVPVRLGRYVLRAATAAIPSTSISPSPNRSCSTCRRRPC